jgi:hypothetical protein
MVRIELEALEMIEMLPVAPLPEVGANPTSKVKFCPGGNVSGRFNPVTLKAGSLRLASVMVTLESPEFVSVSD